MNKVSKIGLICLTIIFYTLTASASTSSNADADHNINDALKEVGVAALPSFLDAATNKITIKFPKALGGKKLTFGGTIDAEALTNKQFVFDTSEKHEIRWQNAFGMPFLDLDGVEMHLAVDADSFEISLKGKLGGAFRHKGKDLDIEIDLSIEDEKINDFSIALPHSKLSLHAIKELQNVPGISKFKIEKPVISMHAISGQIDFIKDNVNALVFYDTDHKDWNIGFRFDEALTLADITGHKKSFLKHIPLPAMQLITSSKGYAGNYDDLPLAGQAFFSQDGELPEGELEIEEGVSLSAEFDPEKVPSNVKKSLSTLGLGNTSLELEGTVSGMFKGSPAVDLLVDIDTPSAHGFPFLKVKDTKVGFFMHLSESSAGIGFRTAVLMSQGKKKDDLEFDVDFGLKETDTEIEVQVLGEMKGDWKNAAGIHGLTIENPSLSVGINESGSFDTLIDGTVMMGSEKVRAAADLVLSPEALGLPTAFALAGEINKLSFDNLIKQAAKHSKHNKGFGKLSVEFEDMAFAFMTPGSSLPDDLQDDLNIEGAGLAMKASLYIDHKEIGSANGYASTEGISINGDLAPFKLGPLKLKDAELSVQAGDDVDPEFKMSGDFTLFKGFEESYTIDLEPSKMLLQTDTKFGGAFEALLSVETSGIHFHEGDDLSFQAELAANYDKIFHEMVEDAVKALKKGDKDINSAKHKVSSAQKSVSHINNEIKSAKAKAQKQYDAAKKKFDSAKKKVDSIKKTISVNKDKAHHLDSEAKKDAKHLKLGKSAKEGTEEAGIKTAIVAEEAALKTANAVLKAAEKTYKGLSVSANPKVLSLEVQLKTEQAALSVAKDVLSAAESVNKGVESAVKALAKGITALKINRLGAEGSLEGILSGGKRGKAPTLIVDVNIHGKHHVYHENLDVLEHGFKKLAKDVAKKVADEIVNAYK